MRSPVPALLAVALPLVVLWVGVQGVLRYQPRSRTAGEVRELANAGRVLNGRRLDTSVVAQMEAELDKHEPEVLILGNSVANTNIDPGLLAQALDLPAKKVRVLSVPNSVGTHWYAILKNRVYAHGHHPSLVIVVSALQSMLVVQPYSEASRTNLVVQLDPVEPLVDAAVPRSWMLVRSLRERRGMVRDGLLADARDAAIGLAYPGDMLRQDNEAALGRVFHDANVDMDLYGSAMPVVETREVHHGANAVPHPNASFLPHLFALASEHGTTVLLARSPMAPRTPEDEQDVVPDGWLDATAALAHEYGHALVDLSALPLPDALFHNPGHMTDDGAGMFTRTLARVIASESLLGAPEHRVFRAAPLAPVRVEGPPAQVHPDAVALAHAMDGRWVGPGGALVVDLPAWEHGDDAWGLTLLAEQHDAGDLPALTLGGRRVGMDVQTIQGERARIRANVDKNPPRSATTFQVKVPDDGPPLLVEGLILGVGAGSRVLVGRRANHLAAQYDLLGQVELRDGRVVFADPRTTYRADPPPVPRAKRAVSVSRHRPMLGSIEAKDLDFLSDIHTAANTPLHIRCSPMQVLEDGVPLPHVHESCNEQVLEPLGRVCHGPGARVVFVTSDGADIVESGRAYTLALDPERGCGSGRWLYPGDRMVLDVPPDVVQRFREGARSLTVTALSPEKKEAGLSVMLRTADRVLLRDFVLASGKAPAERVLRLEQPLWPTDTGVQLIVEAPADRFALVTGAVLASGYRPR